MIGLNFRFVTRLETAIYLETIQPVVKIIILTRFKP